MRVQCVLAMSVAVLTPLAARGQTWFAKDSSVFLKIPPAAMAADSSLSWGTYKPEYRASIQVVADSILVNNTRGWKAAGLPFVLERQIASIKQDKKKGTLEVTLKAKKEPTTHLTFLSGAEQAIAAVFAPLSQLDAARRECYSALADRLFTGPLASLSNDSKYALLLFAHVTAGAADIASTVYKDKTYLAIDLGVEPAVYNDLRLNQGQRVATVLNDHLFTILKGFAAPVANAHTLDGLKLTLSIPHKDLTRTYAAPDVDRLEMYATATEIRRFVDADITSQQFVDASIVVVNGNRIAVPLAQ